MSQSIQKTTLCFVINDNKILLLERKDTWYENEKYLPPGGNVDEGEDPKNACVRELLEETGIQVDVTKMKLLWNYSNELVGRLFDNYYYITTEYQGELDNKEPHRHSDVAWFSLDKLPKNTSQIVYDTLNRI